MLYEQIVSSEPINKGWSVDQKYCVILSDGRKLLLRITPYDKQKNRRQLYELLQRVETLDIPMCRTLEVGTCEDGEYLLYEWIEGEDAEEIIPKLSKQEQYHLGIQAGEILKKIHSIPAPDDTEEWEVYFKRKADRNIGRYQNCPIALEGAEVILDYLSQNRDCLKNRPQSFQHGDYHIGNMMMRNGELVIIDFDRFSFGDPWEEFNRIVWCAQKVPFFGAGMLDGYFDFAIPEAFWRCLAFYIGSNTLASISWAIDFGEGEIAVMEQQAKEVLCWYDNFKTVYPGWYLKCKRELKI